ncbi:MAG: hypothetical protein GF308_21245 [Candidatus Heimdallarchaeota archaeon]|nr:hypothetical protein [Candidatus Heimdallarchaeota archaeon]
MYTFGTVAIGGGLGEAFGLIVAGVFWVENKKSYLILTRTHIQWKDRTKDGQRSYEELERVTIIDKKL